MQRFQQFHRRHIQNPISLKYIIKYYPDLAFKLMDKTLKPEIRGSVCIGPRYLTGRLRELIPVGTRAKKEKLGL